MRSGPSATTTSCRARRQRKRIGGPSGTSAKTSSIGSGLARRSGRGLKLASTRKRRNASQPGSARACAGTACAASSGVLLAWAIEGAARRRPRRAPQRAAAAASEPRAQAVDEAVELGLFLAGAETDLLVGTRFGVEYREPRQIEAEAGIDLVGQRGESLNK